VLTGTQDNDEIIERVAALDIGKADLVCCVRVPDDNRPGRRLQEVETYSTMTRSLLGMAGHLACLGVTRVVMEATSDYQMPVFYLLEAAGFETWLVNAKDVKHLPGRPKTDKLDAAWLADQATSPAQRHVRSLPRSAGKIVSDESQLHGCLEAGVHASDRRPRLAAATPGRLERATYRRERKVT
jgi:transposase